MSMKRLLLLCLFLLVIQIHISANSAVFYDEIYQNADNSTTLVNPIYAIGDLEYPFLVYALPIHYYKRDIICRLFGFDTFLPFSEAVQSSVIGIYIDDSGNPTDTEKRTVYTKIACLKSNTPFKQNVKFSSTKSNRDGSTTFMETKFVAGDHEYDFYRAEVPVEYPLRDAMCRLFGFKQFVHLSDTNKPGVGMRIDNNGNPVGTENRWVYTKISCI